MKAVFRFYSLTLSAVLLGLTPGMLGAADSGAPAADTAVVGAGKKSEAANDTGTSLNHSPALQGEPVLVRVDWNEPLFAVPQGVYSVAGFQSGNPTVAAHPSYQAGLKHMGIRVLRYHTVESMMDAAKNPNGWIDYAAKAWAAERIVAAVSAWHPEGVRKVVNIASWPSWMDQNNDGFLDTDQYDAFAQWCAELVRILNVEAKLRISSFEVTNEKDGLYWIDPVKHKQAPQIEALAEIYNRAAVAMKRVDPSILVGGPSAMRPDENEPLLKWAELVLPHLDFLSVHMYASGDTSHPDSHIWDRTTVFGKAAVELRKALSQLSPTRHIELHVNEFNISWTWETREPRMSNHLGAVFDALALVEFARAGVDVVNAWNECDGIYGKMNNQYSLRPGAHVFHLLNAHFHGDAVAVTSSHPRRVEAFAVKTAAGEHNVLLINRSSKAHRVELTGVYPGGNSTLKVYRVDASGFENEVQAWDGFMLEVPPESVSVLSSQERGML